MWLIILLKKKLQMGCVYLKYTSSNGILQKNATLFFKLPLSHKNEFMNFIWRHEYCEALEGRHAIICPKSAPVVIFIL